MRVSRLEDDVRDSKATMGRLELLIVEIKAALDATLPRRATNAEITHLRSEMRADMAQFRQERTAERSEFRLATGAEFPALRLETNQSISDLRTATMSEFAAVHGDLAEKPSKTHRWGVLTALLTADARGLAALAILT